MTTSGWRSSNGQVLLTGGVDFDYEADAAYETVADMIGVLGVTIGIRVTSVARDAGCLLDRVSAALRHAHGPLIAGISVCAWRGEVTLRETLSSLAEHDATLATVWAVPGVASVRDVLAIDAGPRGASHDNGAATV